LARHEELFDFFKAPQFDLGLLFCLADSLVANPLPVSQRRRQWRGQRACRALHISRIRRAFHTIVAWHTVQSPCIGASPFLAPPSRFGASMPPSRDRRTDPLTCRHPDTKRVTRANGRNLETRIYMKENLRAHLAWRDSQTPSVVTDPRRVECAKVDT